MRNKVICVLVFFNLATFYRSWADHTAKHFFVCNLSILILKYFKHMDKYSKVYDRYPRTHHPFLKDVNSLAQTWSWKCTKKRRKRLEIRPTEVQKSESGKYCWSVELRRGTLICYWSDSQLIGKAIWETPNKVVTKWQKYFQTLLVCKRYLYKWNYLLYG